MMNKNIIAGIKSAASEAEGQGPEWLPWNWRLGVDIPGGEVLQNPLIAGLGGALGGSLGEMLLTGGKPDVGTLVAALLGGGGLGALSYGAKKSLETPYYTEKKEEKEE